jgi:hypothetical protein
MQHVGSRRHDEWAMLRLKVSDMLEAAEAAYQDAAAMHSMGKVSHHGGRISALKAVLAAMDE